MPPKRPACLPRGRTALGEARRPRDRRLRADAGGPRGPLRDPGEGRQGDPARHRSDLHAGRRRARRRRTCSWSESVQRRKDPRAAVDAANELGMPVVVVGPEREPALAQRAARARRRRARLRGSRGAPEALPRGVRAGRPVPVRGLRPSGAGGDGERDARRRRARPRARRSGGRRRGLRRPGRPLAARSCTRSTGGWSCAGPGSCGRRVSAGTRPRGARRASTGACCEHRGSRRRRTSRSRSWSAASRR